MEAFVFSVYPDSAQSQKGSMWPKGRLMCWIHSPPPPSSSSWSSSLLSVYLTVRDSTERAEIDSHPPSNPEIGLVFHIGWYETFRGGLGETGRGKGGWGGIVLGRWDWYWWRWQDGDVGIGRTDWSWERSEKLRQRWKSWRPAPWDWRDLPRCFIPTIPEPRDSSQTGCSSPLDKSSSGV